MCGMLSYKKDTPEIIHTQGDRLEGLDFTDILWLSGTPHLILYIYRCHMSKSVIIIKLMNGVYTYRST